MLPGSAVRVDYQQETVGFNKHPPLGVNATPALIQALKDSERLVVSTSTHPWG